MYSPVPSTRQGARRLPGGCVRRIGALSWAPPRRAVESFLRPDPWPLLPRVPVSTMVLCCFHILGGCSGAQNRLAQPSKAWVRTTAAGWGTPCVCSYPLYKCSPSSRTHFRQFLQVYSYLRNICEGEAGGLGSMRSLSQAHNQRAGSKQSIQDSILCSAGDASTAREGSTAPHQGHRNSTFSFVFCELFEIPSCME